MEFNYWAILIGGLVYYAGGALWYSPILFGKQWMAAAGITEEKMNEAKPHAWKSYITALISQLIISYGLARLMGYLDVNSISGGLHTAFWTWLAFVVTTMAVNGAFSMKPVRLMLIDAGYHLYGFLVAGIIISLWQ
jgi:hypothetical protein